MGKKSLHEEKGRRKQARERPVGGRCGTGAAVARQAQGPGPGRDAMILDFRMLSFKPMFHSPLSISSSVSLVLPFLP